MKKDRRIVNGVNNFTLCPLERKSEIRVIPVNGKSRMAVYVGGQFWLVPAKLTKAIIIYKNDAFGRLFERVNELR